MPGGKHQLSRLGKSLSGDVTGRIKRELDGLISLWMKQVRVQSIPVAMVGRTHETRVGIGTDIWDVDLLPQQPTTQRLDIQASVQSLELPEWQAVITTDNVTCEFATPSIASVPTFADSSVPLYVVKPIPLKPEHYRLDVPAIAPARKDLLRAVPISSLKSIIGQQSQFKPVEPTVITTSLLDRLTKHPKSWVTPRRFYQLPMLRRPLPLYRFSQTHKDWFRKALAGKAGIGEARIQVTRVYDRIDLNTVDGFEIDPQGQLWITPKANLVGEAAKRAKLSSPDVDKSAWIVLGTRLDTQESIRAVVPVGIVQQALQDAIPDERA